MKITVYKYPSQKPKNACLKIINIYFFADCGNQKINSENMARFYSEFNNQFFFITAASLLGFGLFVMIGNLTYYNIAFIPSVSELIVLGIGYRIAFLCIVFLSQTSRTILYVELEDQLNKMKSTHDHVDIQRLTKSEKINHIEKMQANKRAKWYIQLVILASYLQTLFFLLVAIVDVDKEPLAHAIVTLVAFLFALLRQVPFFLIKSLFNNQDQWCDVFELTHCLAIIVFIGVFGGISYFQSDNPYVFNALFEYIAVYLVLSLPLYNYPVVEQLIGQRSGDFVNTNNS